MALKALSLQEVQTMNKEECTAYFEEYAGYFEDSPITPYAIRVGSITLFSDDTHNLRQQFDYVLRYGKKSKLVPSPVPLTVSR